MEVWWTISAGYLLPRVSFGSSVLFQRQIYISDWAWRIPNHFRHLWVNSEQDYFMSAVIKERHNPKLEWHSRRIKEIKTCRICISVAKKRNPLEAGYYYVFHLTVDFKYYPFYKQLSKPGRRFAYYWITRPFLCCNNNGSLSQAKNI